MAEARSLQAFEQFSKRGIELGITEEGGYHITINVPPPKKLKRSLVRKLHRRRNGLVNSFFPLGPALVVPIVGMFTYFVFHSPPESWWRSGWLATLVWDLSFWVPGSVYFDRAGRIIACSILSGAVIALLLASLNRTIISLLLSYRGWMYLEPRQKMPLVVKVWGGILTMCMKVYRKPLMYSWQSSMPALPLPSLKATCDRYLKSVRPLMDDAEFEKSQQMAEEFMRKEGRKLQWYLRIKWLLTPNYVSDWWEKYVYLRGRSPLLINSNPYTLGSHKLVPTRNQAARAGSVLYWLMRFRKLLDQERVDPILIRNMIPLCMKQYERTFGTTRIPGRECDSLRQWDTAESKHVVVLSRGRFFSVQIVHEDGALMTPHELEQQFEAVLNESKRLPAAHFAESHLPALTAWDRTKWAETREQFFSIGVNRHSLQKIESAAIFVTLDEREPEDLSDQAKLALCGNGATRWFDKSLSVIVYANGRIAMNGEHSWADAPVASHMWEWATNVMEPDGPGFTKDGRNVVTESGSLSNAPIKPPKRLVWDLFDATNAVKEAFNDAKKLIDDLDHIVVEHMDFGKSKVKKCKVSPDSFVQMALQLAYFRDAGKPCLTYEAAMARLYKNGRTETIRSCSVESAVFVSTMESKSATREEKAKALQRACSIHQTISRHAMNGMGVDRHLFALYVVAIGTGIESEFLSKNVMSRPWTLSTSQVLPNQTPLWNPVKTPERVSSGGFGPVADDGYGCSYSVLDHMFTFHISSKVSSDKTDSRRFANHIQKALNDIEQLFD